VVQQGGLLALPSNIGTQTRNRFAVIPELGVKVGYQLTDHIRVYAGYNFLYASSVVRPGNQIDPVINRAQLPLVVARAPKRGSHRRGGCSSRSISTPTASCSAWRSSIERRPGETGEPGRQPAETSEVCETSEVSAG